MNKAITFVFGSALLLLFCAGFGVLQPVATFSISTANRVVALGEIVVVLGLLGGSAFGLLWLGRKTISGVFRGIQKTIIIHHDFEMRKIERLNAKTKMQTLEPGQSLATNRIDIQLLHQNYQHVQKGGGILDVQRVQFHTVPTIRTATTTAGELPAPSNQDQQIRRGDWLESFVLDQNRANFHHLQICGATGSGKTTLALAVVELLQRPLTEAEYYLSDPKWEGVLSNWPFLPVCYEFDDVPQFANFVYGDIYEPRKAAVRRGELPAHSAFALFDEVDGCFAEHNKAFTGPLKRIIKEARHAKLHGILIGQSPLAQDCGLNTSDMQQAARLVLTSEALRYLNNPSFPYASDKEQKKIWRDQVRQLERNGERACLAIPQRGQPFVAVVPEIDVTGLRFENMARTDEPITLDQGKNGDVGRPSGKRPADYEGKEREIAKCIAKGMNKTTTRKHVKGANAEIGKLYDQIAKEMAG